MIEEKTEVERIIEERRQNFKERRAEIRNKFEQINACRTKHGLRPLKILDCLKENP